MAGRNRHFPYDVFATKNFPGRTGELIEQVRPMSMFPPFPWGQWLYAQVFDEVCSGLEGDVVEAGVGSGGMSLFLAMLAKDAGHDRQVFAVDSYEGLPEPDAQKDNPYFVKGEYGANALMEKLTLSAAAFGVEDKVVPVKGFFEEVLPGVGSDREFCFVHIDADLYSSVWCALDQLYDRVVPGGVIAFDDFFHPGQGPTRAAAEFFNSRGLAPIYNVAFPYSVFVIKEDWGRVSRSVDGNAYSLDWLRRDEFFLTRLEASRKNARRHPAGKNAARLLEALRADESYPGEIYDYWRSLEAFWSQIDVWPDTKVPW